MGAEVVKTVCEPVANKRRPANAYDAQFSIPYLVAASLVRGRFTLAELEPEALSDERILRLCDLVDYEVDARSTFPRHYTGEGTLEDRLQRLRESPLDGGVQAMAWDDRGWVTALMAMVGALLLMLPIAWAYVATRERKKVDHSVVATITLMPMAVAAILVIVQDSLAVAFSQKGGGDPQKMSEQFVARPSK